MADSQPKIMVVDDDEGVRITLDGIIDDEGYDVIGAEDGTKAIELAKETPFDLILMDIKMPGINGVETYREIKKISPQSVVAMMTGFYVEDLIKEALDEGAYAVIYKPFTVEGVMDIVQAVLKTVMVLVVDDLATQRQTLRAILEENDYAVAEADNGKEAIAMATERHYGVVLMDMQMPGIAGITAFEEIRKIDPLVKVVFLTGYTLGESAMEALLASAYTVLTKPVDPDDLLALIKSIPK